ncbi:hypothetical protein GGF31_008681 [Allomyces arbusculus]|nr:hypothetical protein GGF31_008681 [Allomyces arbusculus]
MTCTTTLLLALLAVLAVLAVLTASSNVAVASPVREINALRAFHDTNANSNESLHPPIEKGTVGIKKGTGKGPGKGGSKGGSLCWYVHVSVHLANEWGREMYSSDNQRHCTACYVKSTGQMWCKKQNGCKMYGNKFYCPECPQNDPDVKKCK